MTIRAHLDPTTYNGSATIVAKIINTAGTQVGANVALVESGTVDGLFSAAYPVLAAGEYDIRIEDTSDSSFLGMATVFWDGSAEVTEDTLRAQIAAIDLSNLDVAVSTRSTVTTTEVNAEVDTALADYDAPTKAELDTAESNIIAALPSVAGLATSAQVAALPTPLTAAEVNAEVDTALADYDAPTKAELDTAESNIIAALPSVAGLATSAEVAGVAATLADVLEDTGTTLPGLIGALNNLDSAAVQAALTAQGYTTARAAEISETLDHLKNRLEIDETTDPISLVLYARDGTTVLYRWDLTSLGGAAVTLRAGIQTRRGAPS